LTSPITKLSRAPIFSRVVSIADLRSLARRRLPKAVFDYPDGGAEGEVTLRENWRVFEDVTFRPRQAVPVPGCELRTRFLGLELSFPALLAPVGYGRLMHPGGEVAAARAAGLAGTAYILSTISGHPPEDVKASPSGPVFYQLYPPAAGMRFDRRVGSFVRERSSRLVSRLNAGRKTHLPQRTASPTSEKRIASLQFENASQTNCLPDNSWNLCARQDQAV
jgi:hypothetical protein